MKIKVRNYLSNYQIIAVGFLFLILFGAVILSLPISSADGESTPFLNALFTSTSAVCVTGLVVYDTFLHWSMLGKIVILLLIQVGGLGLMTVITLCSLLLGKKLSVRDIKLASQSSGAMSSGATIALIRRVVYGGLFVEAVGAALLAVRFCPKYGFFNGLGLSVFHSVSAFCNAGFDLFGRYGEFSSVTPFVQDHWVNAVLMLLIIIGGVGVIVWGDVLKHKQHISKYSLHSKIVLATNTLLIVLGFVSFMLLEHDNTLAGFSIPQKITASMFMSVSPRTAGFNTVPMDGLTGGSKLLTIILMLVGGSPGSTAGGMKTTTLAVILICTLSAARGLENAEIFKKRLTNDVIYQAVAVFSIYVAAVFTGAIVICSMQNFPIIDCLFEAASAAGTVGLTTGLTPLLNTASKIIVMLLMFAGRIGLLTFAMVIGEKKKKAPVARPTEKIML
ncbi:MAG: TrkH family potassium uptake protein [Clostridia bacterium]